MLNPFKGAIRAARFPALLAAGALGIVSAAAAREPLFGTSKPAKPAAAAPAQAPQKAAAAQPSDPVGRVEEIKVELAWRGDETTFSWPLHAKAVGRIMQISGETPTLASREQAVKLARQSTQLLVIDGVRVNPALPAPQAAGSVEQTLGGVLEEMHKVLGDKASKIDVGSASDGRITLRGSVPSYEDKLKLSDSLRQVKGCTSVVNLVNVAPVVHGDSAILPVSANDQAGIPIAGGPVAADTKAKETPAPAAKIDAPRTLPAAVFAAPAPAAPVIANAEKNPTPPAPIAATTAKPGSLPKSPYAPARGGVAAYNAAVQSAAYSTSAQTDQTQAEKSPSRKRKTLFTLFAQDKEKDKTPAITAPATTKDAPKALPTAMLKEQSPVKTTAADSRTVTASKQAPAATQAVVTTAQLRQKVLAACAGTTRDVRIQVQADKMVNVLVKVTSSEAEQAVVEKVLQLPEMMAPNVQLSVEIVGASKK